VHESKSDAAGIVTQIFIYIQKSKHRSRQTNNAIHDTLMDILRERFSIPEVNCLNANRKNSNLRCLQLLRNMDRLRPEWRVSDVVCSRLPLSNL